VIKYDTASVRDMPTEKTLQYQLMYQLSRVTRARGALAHDDRLDAVAMGVGYWSEKMAQDSDKKMAVRKTAMLDKELREFMKNAVGYKLRPTTWM
jgi:hypothetical protein